MSNLQTKIVISAQDKASQSLRNVRKEAASLYETLEKWGKNSKLLMFGRTFTALGSDVLDSALSMDRLDKAFTSITSSSALASDKLDYVKNLCGEMGLDFLTTAESAKNFFAAGQGSTIEKDLDKIFESVMTASSALALSGDETGRALTVLTAKEHTVIARRASF